MSTLVDGRPTLGKLRDAAAGCRRCHLWERGTQTVFGEGWACAAVLLVGEQPGNEEDLAGRKPEIVVPSARPRRRPCSAAPSA